MNAEVVGLHGRADALPVPEDSPAALCWWLITAPSYHPVWTQYMLSVVTLADVEGIEPATLKFPGATHELLLFAVDPSKPEGGATPEKIAAGEKVGHLTPINICEQFTATDEEMIELAELACWGVVNGALNPETADAPQRIRSQWLSAMVKTLAHIRGEEHAP